MSTELVPAAVTTPAPTTSQTTESWLFADHIDEEHRRALMAMAGLTVSPDVLSINGNEHEIQP